MLVCSLKNKHFSWYYPRHSTHFKDGLQWILSWWPHFSHDSLQQYRNLCIWRQSHPLSLISPWPPCLMLSHYFVRGRANLMLMYIKSLRTHLTLPEVLDVFGMFCGMFFTVITQNAWSSGSPYEDTKINLPSYKYVCIYIFVLFFGGIIPGGAQDFLLALSSGILVGLGYNKWCCRLNQEVYV